MSNPNLTYLYELENPKIDTLLNRIGNHLSLRQPLKDALRILAYMADDLSLDKEVNLQAELDKVSTKYPSCTDFERNFVSLCFSIATGVGKTRLMGAVITYLFLKKNIRNFFVLAPNLTIYEKLINDFGKPNYPKYVFKGISEFANYPPIIITGDNYAQQNLDFSPKEIKINIFNISKFNSENKTRTGKGEKGKPPRIKRISEYLGQSYWQYLVGLDDLVILMDEAHRYHADASKNALNELKPILGIELTATPTDEKGKAFKNIVYQYNLAQALADSKYVKSPAIATRKDFDKSNFTPLEIEQIKLEDAISVHEDTKTELELYARNFKVELVKPFILVVCKDINHASEVHQYVESNNFYNGQYQGKVLRIDSSTKKAEDIEKQFLTLENKDNTIEIVIHVNMLKEGWDVTNLYTIVPLRAANASVLIEQTIGRGLRLPYNGRRTGIDKVDKLTVLAHDNFDKVINEAQNPNSILNKLSYVVLDQEQLNTSQQVVVSPTKINAEVKREQVKIAQVQNPEKKQQLTHQLEAKKAIVNAIPSLTVSDGVKRTEDLRKPKVKNKIIEKIKSDLNKGQTNLFSQNIIEEAEAIYHAVVESYKTQIIEIPRMVVTPSKVDVWFEDFDLDVSTGFDLKVFEQEIIRMRLDDKSVDTIGIIRGAYMKEKPTNLIISELINYPEVDYDDNAILLNKLANQVLDKFKETNPANDIPQLIRQYRKPIASRIYDQLQKHFKQSTQVFESYNILPFVRIEDWNFTVPKLDGYRHYTDIVRPLSSVSKYVYLGFEKACHNEYKFDSNTEKDFAFIIENDNAVLKWLRPAQNQFRIYWENNKQYNPDFIVETDEAILICETKAARELESEEVKKKSNAALKYCKNASEFTKNNNGKLWKYLLIPHDKIDKTSSFNKLADQFEVKFY